ncbi:MAG: class I SAM-dependent methyltransferase [Myxococcales bacterium]|nr:class I SAM-dependent methyltransferase [Myxococcales bacterium]
MSDAPAGGEHRVATHLGVSAADYDRQIRRFIPGYEEMLREVVSILDEVLPNGAHRSMDAAAPGAAAPGVSSPWAGALGVASPGAASPGAPFSAPLVADLGAGTGALSAAILDGIPRARALLVDIDPHMLEVAQARLAPHAARFELRRARFEDPLPPCDAIVASLSLHHVAEVDAKRTLYRHLRSSLRPGGVFLSADATVHPSGPEHDRVFRTWTAGMFDAGIGPGEAEALFAQWSREDTYQPLSVELALLADAGFERPECFWRKGPVTVFGAFA